jgi:hypothetical protein
MRSCILKLCRSNGENILDTNYLQLPWALRTEDESIGSLNDARGDIVVQVQQRSDDFKTRNAVRRDTTDFVLVACNSHHALVEALARIRAGRTDNDLAQRLTDTEMARIADEALTAAGLQGAISPLAKQVLST